VVRLLAQALGSWVQAVWSGHRDPHVARARLTLAANLHTASNIQQSQYHSGNNRDDNQWVHLYIQREKVGAIHSVNKNKIKK